ncbi:hypothetical protein JHK85_055796 [Glycine max]|uniref:Protein PHLOEM PROTEIN 2-LIKE A1 n=1 Tax=Glycine soja TaxID=3848 RepID=A0A445EZR6_GLYSO|nr:uncharacterized protein LOC114401171 [Glycine soja]KAG4906353.1 hypothetical protein JHK86_054837 [Glycine max]KAG4917515.1 hypothetical protein JHK85_055796 [Glycine max]KHN08034.1 Protein PHLOEM PROTEIN 2-LIKE A1 [Glycine soja]RZB42055.1 Protein PHLOEM PROTEIN 2-LIKE A1 [Glycine soja]
MGASQSQEELQSQQQFQQHQHPNELTRRESLLLSPAASNNTKQFSNSTKVVDNVTAANSTNTNCFMLNARALSITWAENPDYWTWVQDKDESGTMIELPNLKMVCWLEVHGKFDTRKLSLGILYQVSFIVMLKDSAQGWEVPINVRLVLPGGKKQQHKENLNEKLRECWIEIPVGEFVASEKDVGNLEISMYEYEGGKWKTGLIIQGIAIKPKNETNQSQHHQQPHELTRRESWLMSPAGNSKYFKNSTKAIDNVTSASNTNSFMVYARSLSITWAENPNYWKWVQHKEASGTMTELAKLKMVCWLEVHGKFDARKLLPGIPYQVLFIVMLKDSAQGWEVPINFRLVLPGGKKQEHKENLNKKLRESWIHIPVGEFVASEKDVGNIEISMYEYEGGMWKTGLIIQGIVIKPKN